MSGKKWWEIRMVRSVAVVGIGRGEMLGGDILYVVLRTITFMLTFLSTVDRRYSHHILCWLIV